MNHSIRGLFRDFYDQLKVIVQGIRLAGNKNAKDILTNEDIAYLTLNYVVLQTQHSSFSSEVYASKLHSDKIGRANVKIINKTKAQ